MNESPVARLVDLTGRVALVTGAARGLGRAAVLRLHELGAREVADLIAFVASDAAGYITGASFDITGGDLMM